ncbi:MAG: flagellar biosynthesis anti-sigma factor FlgM, partial [Pseudomonadota bacterium]
DSINAANVARLRPAEPNARTPAAPSGGTASPAPVGAAEDVALSGAANAAVLRASAAEPPFNAEQVAKIKAAIADGNYPLDSRAITESFFRDMEVPL